MSIKKVEIYTDGSCLGNPGCGGYGIVMRYQTTVKEFSGGFKLTTNNRMELLAAIVALELLKESCAVVLFSDSKYVQQGVTKWMHSWKKNGWRTSSKGKVKNKDLWLRLDAITAKHEIVWNWVKGHAGDPINERCDSLAVAAARDNPDIDDLGYLAEIKQP